MRIFIALGLSLLITACGTTRTVLMGDNSTREQMKKAETYCDSLPRVYSGVSYDFCLFYAEPSSDNPNAHQSRGTPLRVFDFALSGVADTLALPYTIFRQAKDGNIPLDD